MITAERTQLATDQINNTQAFIVQALARLPFDIGPGSEPVQKFASLAAKALAHLPSICSL